VIPVELALTLDLEPLRSMFSAAYAEAFNSGDQSRQRLTPERAGIRRPRVYALIYPRIAATT
jgi:hypothetical protein